MPTYTPTYEVWVHEDAGVGDALGSHLVPTWFYLTPGGDVLGKLVGYKSPEQIRAWIEKLPDQNKNNGLAIGCLARRAEVATSTVRYYERIRLLTPPRRTESNYRLYTGDAVERLRFIRAAQVAGLTLGDIRTLLAYWDREFSDGSESQEASAQVISVRPAVDGSDTSLHDPGQGDLGGGRHDEKPQRRHVIRLTPPAAVNTLSLWLRLSCRPGPTAS